MGNLIGGGHEHGPANQGDNFGDARREADELYRQRKELAAQSQEAYRRGDKAGAKVLSNKAKEALHRAEQAQARAAQEVFQKNNGNRSDGMVDLHGLYVAEAEAVAER